MKNILYVFIGGGLGSLLRYGISLLGMTFPLWKPFPLATFLCNLLGSFLIGMSISLLKDIPNLKLLFVMGFCGGFTTFSTFSIENIQFIQNGQYTLAFIYTTLSLLLGFLFVYLGFLLTK